MSYSVEFDRNSRALVYGPGFNGADISSVGGTIIQNRRVPQALLDALQMASGNFNQTDSNHLDQIGQAVDTGRIAIL